jgi:hypothetical protein
MTDDTSLYLCLIAGSAIYYESSIGHGSEIDSMFPPPKMSADEFKAALKKLGLTQKEFAINAGCSDTTVNRWLSTSAKDKRDEVPSWAVRILTFMIAYPDWRERLYIDDVQRAREALAELANTPLAS